MELKDRNAPKISELLEHCQARFRLLQEECFALGLFFLIDEAYRPQYLQRYYFTQNRTLADIESLHQKHIISGEDYSAMRELYVSGKNMPGDHTVTHTLQSIHTQRRAIDIDPVTASGHFLVGTFRDAALSRIARFAALYGIFRPAGTVAFGDYRHFEILNEPLPLDRPSFQRMIARRRARIDRAASTIFPR